MNEQALLQSLALEDVPTCPCCGRERTTYRKRMDWRGLMLNYYRCPCGVWFLSPRMTDEQTGVYYRTIYRKIAPEIAGNQERRAAYWGAYVLRHVKGKTALEIGCSMGMILARYEERGIVPEGVEPDERMRSMSPAKRFKTYSDISEVEGVYDVLSMSHVLEHINHPLEYMTALIERHAHDGTYIALEVPNGAAIRDFRLHHPLWFDQESLDGFLARLGCQRVVSWVHGCGNPFAQYVSGVYRVKK